MVLNTTFNRIYMHTISIEPCMNKIILLKKNLKMYNFGIKSELCKWYITKIGWIVEVYTQHQLSKVKLIKKMRFKHHFQQYFSYIMVVSFIDGGYLSTWRKPPTCRKSLTKWCLWHLLSAFFLLIWLWKVDVECTLSYDLITKTSNCKYIF
jgi:hypothetical protein